MQKNRFTLIAAQLIGLAAFGIMAGASASPQPVTHYTYDIKRADIDEGLQEGYVFVGSFNSENEAKDACLKMGFTNYYFKDGNCFGTK